MDRCKTTCPGRARVPFLAVALVLQAFVSQATAGDRSPFFMRDDRGVTMASLLNVKPVIYLREGVLELGDRVRTRRKALDYIVEQMSRRVSTRLVNAAVIHSEDPQSAQVLAEQVRKVLNCKELILTELSIGIAANLGPGTVGVVAYPVEGG